MIIKKVRIDTSEGDNLINSLKSDSIVLFAGSPISEYLPTALISGLNFTKALFAILFNNDIYNPKIKIDNSIWKILYKTPFEHIMELCPPQSEKKIEELILTKYSKNLSNPFHKVIADAFISRKIHSIITPNYDLCLENEIDKHKFNYIKIVSEEEAWKCQDQDLPLLFKIHGSADKRDSEKPIFNIKRETYLPTGKKRLLEKLTSSRTLLFIAYSGLDFDICPTLSRLRNFKLIWNTYTEEIPSNNTQQLLEEKDGIQLIGDMKVVLSKLINPFSVTKQDKATEDRALNDFEKELLMLFSKEELRTWQINLLNSIAVPKVTIELLDSYSSIPLIGNIEKKERARALFHTGRYFDSARNYLSFVIHSIVNRNRFECGDCLLEASDAIRSAGGIFSPFLFLGLSWILGNQLSRSRVTLKYLLIIAKMSIALTMLKLEKISLLLRPKIKSLLIRCASESIKNSNWFDYQQIGLICVEVGIDLSDLEDSTRYAPPNPEDGYEHLAYILAKEIVFLDQGISYIGKSLTFPEKNLYRNELLQHINLSKKLGLNVIVWKQVALLFHFVEKPEWETKYKNEFISYLNRCQYFPWGKKIQVKRYCLPKTI